MNNPRRRQHLTLVGLATAVALVTLWYTLLDTPRSQLRAKLAARADTLSKLNQARQQIAEAARVKAAVDAASVKLQNIESRIPAGDPYRWLVKAFAEFPGATNIAIANIEPPHVSESVVLLPKIPYKSANFTLAGTAYYHQFGSFLAALENYFPHMRVKKLDLSPLYPGEPDSPEAEKLAFHIELSILFKPAASAPPGPLSALPTPPRP